MNKIPSTQLAEGEIREIAGGTVEGILAARGSATDRVLLVYILLDDSWLRAFLDEGVLFLGPCDGPDPEDDLDAGDEYLDFSGIWSVRGEEIRKASVKDGAFRIAFKSGAELILEESGEEATLAFVR